MAEQLYRVAAIAKFLDMSTRNVYRLIASGDLKVIRVGKRAVRVSDGALRAYLRSIN